MVTPPPTSRPSQSGGGSALGAGVPVLPGLQFAEEAA